MLRRLHVPVLRPGIIELDEAQSHHARNVLRLGVGDDVELFDDEGNTGAGRVSEVLPRMRIAISTTCPPATELPRIAVASAIPKGARADWMVEKLSELGVVRLTPLLTARGVVMAENKRRRWQRLAEESAKQCRREGVLRIDPPAKLDEALGNLRGHGWFFSTTAGAVSPLSAAESLAKCPYLFLFIGPEGGWTNEEETRLRDRGLTPVSLGTTILRVETAAIAAAAIARTLAGPLGRQVQD